MTTELTQKDWEKIELYMKSGAKPWKIAKSFHLSNAEFRKQIEIKYKKPCDEVLNGYDSLGEMLLEATQFQKALSGNVTMLIWLGKVRCGQKEPELLSIIPAAQPEIDKDHIIMRLQHKIDKMNELMEKYGHKPEAE